MDSLKIPSSWRLCRNGGIRKIVILNEVKNLIISTESIIEILRLPPQDDIATQSHEGGVRVLPVKGGDSWGRE